MLFPLCVLNSGSMRWLLREEHSIFSQSPQVEFRAPHDGFQSLLIPESRDLMPRFGLCEHSTHLLHSSSCGQHRHTHKREMKMLKMDNFKD